jgi:putative selenium metabolism hydrolase
MVNQTVAEQVRGKLDAMREPMLQFLREIIAIPSMDSHIKVVSERVAAEMRHLGFDAVWWDKMGNVVGRIGPEDADVTLLYDSHLDTVGIGDPAEWQWDPFTGKEENGTLFARGACDEKSSTPSMIYGMVAARELGLIPANMAIYYFGNIEEVNEGSAANAFVMTEGIRPDYVVVGEPTNLALYRGQKGRVEYQITARGKSAHAASNHLGDNAIYKVLPIIDQIRQSQDSLPVDDFLGKGAISVTHIEVHAGSRNVVPGAVTVYVDRRLTGGEDAYVELERLRKMIGDRQDIEITIPIYEEPSYTGFIFPLEMVYPAWVTPEDHPFVVAGKQVAALLGMEMSVGHWDFSTNGIYWSGKAGIPTIGFGPGEEQYAHTVLDQVRLDDVVTASYWYALLPQMMNA